MVPLVVEEPVNGMPTGLTKANQKITKEMEIQRNPGNVILTRLKEHEIEKWCTLKSSQPKNRCLKSIKLTMKLRKR